MSRRAGSINRRLFLGGAAAGLGSLAAVSGCGDSTASSAVPPELIGATPASDAHEVRDLKCGIIALTDCSPLVIAHEKGLFKKYGINSTISKGASWAAIRDSLTYGDLQATHMLIGMPLAATMGLGGSKITPMVIPWLLNRN